MGSCRDSASTVYHVARTFFRSDLFQVMAARYFIDSRRLKILASTKCEPDVHHFKNRKYPSNYWMESR